MALSSKKQKDFNTVSVVVLAYNEAANLPKAVDNVRQVITGRFSDYEIIIVDDGSSDKTGRIADDIAASNTHVVSIHNARNRGCGYTFRHGVKTARFEYVWVIPGDGEIPRISLDIIAQAIGTADMLLPYMVNADIRPWYRRVISWGYTNLLNFLFSKSLHYYNGPAVFPLEQVRTTPEVFSCGFAFMAPIIITLMKRKVSWKEVGIFLKRRDSGQPSVNNVVNIFSALRAIAGLYWGLNIAGYFSTNR
jgi:dolichol-phosphate mannosyltransferase